MNKLFQPKKLPLFFNGVLYENIKDLKFERLKFYNLNLTVDIYENDSITWIEGLTIKYKTKVPIKTTKDFNNLSQIMGYGKLLTTKKEDAEYLGTNITVKDKSIAFTDYGVYIDNKLVILFNHKDESANYTLNGKLLERFNQKELYSNIIKTLDSLGWELNHLINESKEFEIREVFMFIQNRLNINKKTTNDT